LHGTTGQVCNSSAQINEDALPKWKSATHFA
jgi:hypothetical protein